jgi:hypothetical protein
LFDDGARHDADDLGQREPVCREATLINPDQLKLFMGGQEWQQTVTDSADRRAGQSLDSLWAQKLEEAKRPSSSGGHGSGLYENISKHGFQLDKAWDKDDYPTLWVGNQPDRPSFRQFEGHHRIAVAAEIERVENRPVWIPTNYRKDPMMWYGR